VVYAAYEWLVQGRILCSGECDIRIDLLVLYPALLGLSCLAVVVGLVRARRAGRSRAFIAAA